MKNTLKKLIKDSKYYLPYNDGHSKYPIYIKEIIEIENRLKVVAYKNEYQGNYIIENIDINKIEDKEIIKLFKETYPEYFI